MAFAAFLPDDKRDTDGEDDDRATMRVLDACIGITVYRMGLLRGAIVKEIWALRSEITKKKQIKKMRCTSKLAMVV